MYVLFLAESYYSIWKLNFQPCSC